MHSFLSKVFGRNTSSSKKDDHDKGGPTSPTSATSPTSPNTNTNENAENRNLSLLVPPEPLGGKFEAVSPNVSPSAAKFLDLDQNQKALEKDKEKAKDTKEKEKDTPSGPASLSFLSR